jgi:hypothetical protein
LLTALASHHIWMPAAEGAILTAAAVCANRSDRRAIYIPELAATTHILVDPDGRQHVLLRSNTTALQLEIEGADIVRSPVLLTFRVWGVDMLGRASSQLSDLRRILSVDATPDVTTSWTVRTRNLRDGFVVYDCISAGGTEREAASLLYGAAAVAQDWRESGLRHRMRRNRQRAVHLIHGGYRSFLK